MTTATRQSPISDAEFRAAADCYGDLGWRMDNLYWIADKLGKEVQFQANRAQLSLASRLWYRNIVLKARQLGITTWGALYGLDQALWHRNTSYALTADTEETAAAVFRGKVLFAYDRLPAAVRSQVRAVKRDGGELALSNGSSVKISTSPRGGTLQVLHVTELGKIAVHYPLKAREIKTGALNTLAEGTVAMIESTAKGREGEFYDMCQAAIARQQQGRGLGPLDWRFHFFPWHQEPGYRLPAGSQVIPDRLTKYFAELASKHSVRLTPEQQAWYTAKEAEQGADMMAEYPSTPDEAFFVAIEGTYYASAMRQAREQGRITTVKADPAVAVFTSWDLGIDDCTCIWFFQERGREIHVIDYYEHNGEGVEFYANVLDQKARENNWRYSRHIAPHDMKAREWGPGKSRLETAASYGIHFTPAPASSVEDGIQAVRRILNLCWFDEARCDQGIKCLDSYRREWNQNSGTWGSRPRHDWSSHGADAFRVFAMTHQWGMSQVGPGPTGSNIVVNAPPAGGWT